MAETAEPPARRWPWVGWCGQCGHAGPLSRAELALALRGELLCCGRRVLCVYAHGGVKPDPETARVDETEAAAV